MMFLAKSDPPETIREHTDKVMQQVDILVNQNDTHYKRLFENYEKLLRLAVTYHDVGKADPAFQRKVTPALRTSTTISLPHNYLSIGLLPLLNLNLKVDEELLLIHAIAYHHERGMLDPHLKEQLEIVLKKDIDPLRNQIEAHMQIDLVGKIMEGFEALDLAASRIEKMNALFLPYILIKGLLHRADHAASAGVNVEIDVEASVGESVQQFFTLHDINKNSLQLFVEEKQDHHIIAIAETGIGKTEAGLLWIGDNKGFFTLPVRSSIDAIFKRVYDDLGFKAASLLHSTSIDFLQTREKGEEENWDEVHLHSRQFANKLLFTTIDQILKFPFFFKTFEKDLTAMIGARVIIDEIQSYDPKIVAMLIHSIEWIDQVGGQFMIMTATLPPLYSDILKERGRLQRPLVEGTFYKSSSAPRHKLSVLDQSIRCENTIKLIISQAETKKVLVIVNTVKQAVSMYQALSATCGRVNLLHSRFMQKDRLILIEELIGFAGKHATDAEPGIWITTQIVEASLDIDFDVLLTEAATLDSLFQRLGRVNRAGEKTVEEPNAFICVSEPTGVGTGKRVIYEKALVDRGINYLRDYNNDFILENKKQAGIQHVYDKKFLQDTQFYHRFQLAMETFDSLQPYSTTKNEAQQMLREMTQVSVISTDVYDSNEVQELLNEYTTSKTERRFEIQKELKRYTISINEWSVKRDLYQDKVLQKLGVYRLMNAKYQFDDGNKAGLLLEKPDVDMFI